MSLKLQKVVEDMKNGLRLNMDRPITIQTHIDPVPEFIVKQVLRHLNMDRKKFFKEMTKV